MEWTATQLWTFAFVALTFGAYLYIGYSNRVRDTKGFYVAGQGVPPVFNGMATAADWMSAASFISMAGLISFMGYDGAVYLMGWTGGYVLLALLLAPYLRKFGKYTVPDFVGDRYASQVARVVAAVCAVFISITYVTGQMRGVGVVFSRFLGVSIAWGVVIGMAIVAFFAVVGGMKGITWTQVAQYTVLIIAFLIPAVAISAKLTGNPIPQLSFTFSDITQKLNQIQVDLGFTEYTAPFQSKSQLDVICIVLALMVGTAGLPHVIVRFYTVPSVRAARYSAGWALFFIAILYTTAPAVAAFARYNLIDTLHDTPVAEARQLEWVRSWEDTGLLILEDRNGDGILQLSPDVATNEIVHRVATSSCSRRRRWRISHPGWSPWWPRVGSRRRSRRRRGLLIVVSSSFAHDIYAKLLHPEASEAQRLRVGRVTIFFGVLIAGYFGINPPGFVAEVVAFAFGLAAASFFPVILLGIFDKRTNRQGAIAGMVLGISFTAAYIIGNRFFGMPAFFFGISAQGIGTVGMLLNLVTTLVVSRMTPPPSQEIQEMVENVRVPRGAGKALEH